MPNLINRTGAEEVVIVGDATGSALVTETDFSIAGFPSVGSCISDLPQPVAGFTNRFQVIAANIDSWRTRISAKFNLYGSTIAGLVASSRSTSHACEINTCAASSNTARLESLTERLNILEMHVSNNPDDLLVIRGMLDNLHACSDSQLSFLINQSQILCGVSPLILSLQVPSASVEIADPKCSVSEGGPEGKTKEVK